ncbi:MAG: DeoR family transcriptional regulator [Candidatus Azambacteria bacterium]|nr:DeoR family transcriptional regulator [Candidatus Azambacteria bacterium]
MEDIFNSELGRKILALTKASFKVSDLIPDLVLREKIKHQVLEVYKTFSVFGPLRQSSSEASGEKNHPELLREIDILDHYFYLGGHLNLIKEEHLKQLQNGFLVFKSHIILLNNNTNDANKNTRMTRIEDNMPNRQLDDLNSKQKKILEKFSEKNTLKLAEILELFPDISERTIRNELTFLIGLGKITRDGRGNGSFYKLTIDS